MAKKRSAINPKRVVRKTTAEISRTRGRSDWERVRAKSDDDIAADIASDPDTVEFTDAMMADAVWHEPEAKELVSVRLDSSVLEFFRGAGKGYSSRINAVLKTYVREQAKREK